MNAYNNNPRDIFDRVKAQNLSKYCKEINFLLKFVNNNLIKTDTNKMCHPPVLESRMSYCIAVQKSTSENFMSTANI